MASRRDDGISYVLAEIASQNVPSLLFQGENGAKIIRYRAMAFYESRGLKPRNIHMEAKL